VSQLRLSIDAFIFIQSKINDNIGVIGLPKRHASIKSGEIITWVVTMTIFAAIDRINFKRVFLSQRTPMQWRFRDFFKGDKK
jgi:hypothetical protein